ncbi:twin-arginine translocation pathway signal protein [Jannaschia sp. S6380]|uniref:Acg family FMN-binding oxidoreductase n=1 Tax=Jannaschia sp. S6380 TaxID=2926408 RepID=UPI001FF6931A|nr:twin-arginine translocation pathway signal protein [Jannaschia sp. S6380]MCK0169193.1 twin-arginine translocation pathway signal protein [Jannaschia sp. S6380]
MTRRNTLKLIGGGTILAATAATGTYLGTRTPHAALAPWAMAGQYDDPRLRALSFALLAPNPHNRQPWEIALEGEDGVVLWRDKTRDLPVTDPFSRQLTIGMGCFLELGRMAAAEEGFDTDVTLFPEGEDGPVARLGLRNGGTPDPLFAHVMERRSHKEPFDPVAVGPEADVLAPYAQLYRDGPDRDRLRQIARDAMMVEANTPAAMKESVDLFRIGRAEIEANPDGIDLGGPMLETLGRVGLLSREAAMDPDNPGTRGHLEGMSDTILSAPAILAQTTRTNTRLDQIETGRRWMRLNLAATGAGLALRPVSQALQEYPEVAEYRRAVHAIVAPDGGTVQMLGLLGYAERTPRTPRWPLETRIRNA